MTPSIPAVFLPGSPASPASQLSVALIWTSLRVFGVYGLLSRYHVVRLERCAFVFCTHAAQTCARAAYANSHSQDQVEVSASPWVPSYLSYYLYLFLPNHCADVSISRTLPLAFAFSAILPSSAYGLVACSLYRPSMRAFLRVIPFRQSVLRSFRLVLSTEDIVG